MECLSHLVEYEVGHVHHVVDWANTDGVECFLEPVWRLLNGHTFDTHARVAWARCGVLHHYLDRQGMAIYFEILNAWLNQCNIHTFRLIICV